MKTITLCIVASVFVLISGTSAFAHPPARIEAHVNKTVVDMCVYHTVSDPADHYVDKIEVQVNGDKVIDQKYTMQPDNTQKAIYIIPSLQKGDEIEIRAHCKKKGEKRTKLLVP